MAYRTLPPFGGDPRQVSEVVRGLMDGKSNNTGTVTLTTTTSTLLSDPRIGYDSVIMFSPLTSTAAGFLSGLYVSARAQGEATLTHASTTASDRLYAYVVVG